MEWKDRIQPAKSSSWKDRIQAPSSEDAESQEPQSFGSKAMDFVHSVGKGIDAYGGDASARAATYSALNGEDPFTAAVNQYGDSESAPTGKMITEKLGVEDKPFPNAVQQYLKHGTLAGHAYQMLPKGLHDSIGNATKSDVAGLGVDMAISPIGFAAKPIAKGLKALSPVGKYIAQKLGKGASYVGEALTGAPAQDIYTYGSKHKKVNELIRDSDKSSAKIADNVRQGYQDAFKETRAKHNAAISAAEDAASTEKTVSLDSILDQIKSAKNKLHTELDAEEIAQLSKLEKILETKKFASPDELVKITKSLQQKGGAHGLGPSGEQLGNQTKQAAKNAGREARRLRNDLIPGVKEPFEKLEKINKIAEEANPNLFQPGKPDPSFYAAGSGRNHRGVKHLEEMGAATGTNMLSPAQEASAARTFMTPALTPLDTTGKSLYRLALAAKIPGLSSLAALITSPQALKTLIDVGIISSDIISPILGKAVNKLSASDYQKIYLAFKGEEMRNRTFDHIKKRKLK